MVENQPVQFIASEFEGQLLMRPSLQVILMFVILLRMSEEPAENGIPKILDCAYAHGSVVIKKETKDEPSLESDLIWYSGMVIISFSF